MFSRGDEVEISYPVRTHVRLWRPDETRRRQLIIHDIRDLLTEPLSVQDFMRRPYLLRSRWLAKAFEPSHRRWRQFYLGSSREYAAPGILQVGLYEPGATKPSKVFGRQFQPTPEDRRLLVKALRQWSRHDFGEAELRILANDLRVIR